MVLLLAFACDLVGLDAGTKPGDACDGEGDLLCTTDGELLECVDDEWSDDVARSCGCDGGEPSCG